MVCSQCGASFPNGSKFCGQCGKPVFTVRKKCQKCKNEYEKEMVFCGNCGTLLSPYSGFDQMQSSILAIERISMFKDGDTSIFPKKSGALLFFNDRITFLPIRGKMTLLSESVDLRYDNIASVDSTERLLGEVVTVSMKNGEKYSFSGAFSQPGGKTGDILQLIKHHTEQ